MHTNDYFTTKDMQAHGSEIWSRVRAKLRAEGHAIVDGYGVYSHAINDRHYIYLSQNGSLVHTKEKPKGLQMDIAKFLGLGKFKALKIKTGNDKDVIRQAFQHLVNLGFSDRNLGSIIHTFNGPLYGLIGDTDGVIYSIQTQNAFDDKFSNVDEIIFDVEVKTIVSNFRPKRKQINLFGYDVHEDIFMQFLKENAIKSAT
jgi:hypothetical protein